MFPSNFSLNLHNPELEDNGNNNFGFAAIFFIPCLLNQYSKFSPVYKQVMTYYTKHTNRHRIIRIERRLEKPSENFESTSPSKIHPSIEDENQIDQPLFEHRNITCPYCYEEFNQRDFIKHVSRIHYRQWVEMANATNPDKAIKCACCSSHIKARKLIEHINRVHLGGIQWGTRKVNSLYRLGADSSSESEGSFGSIVSRDNRDGSKYIGFTRREYENSRFGSYPIHDDYGEDSFPD